MRSLVALAVSALLLVACSTGTPNPSPTRASPSASSSTSATSDAAPPTVGPSATAATGQPGAASSSPTPICEGFGSTADATSADPLLPSTLFGQSMRVGTHDCYDRFVLEMQGSGGRPGWSVGYRDPLIGDPSGELIELAGDAALEVVVRVWTVTPFEGMPADWLPLDGPTEIRPAGYPVIREVRYLSAFEGTTQIGIGVNREHPFRVFWLDGPPRLVIDISHT